MPLTKGKSDATRLQNAREMMDAGHPRAVAWAAAYREQRVAKASHRSRHMPENRSHAPGHEIGMEDGAVRQRNRMGQGGGAMKEDSFGVGPLPGTHIAMNHGEHMPHDGVHLHDDHRSGPPSIDMGDDMMDATAHSHHGPHHHDHDMHEHAPEGHRPHHVMGHKGKR
jgi:hypothetical protein